jgi:hypothetical protein
VCLGYLWFLKQPWKQQPLKQALAFCGQGLQTGHCRWLFLLHASGLSWENVCISQRWPS